MKETGQRWAELYHENKYNEIIVKVCGYILFHCTLDCLDQVQTNLSGENRIGNLFLCEMTVYSRK